METTVKVVTMSEAARALNLSAQQVSKLTRTLPSRGPRLDVVMTPYGRTITVESLRAEIERRRRLQEERP